ncbi:WD40 repeat-like protein [Exidia glandulosa HHB12029]|uniref:WD40 repeat-like protein n=1 Tax=Exidia glandulosa HHB12029 TaxID=1314781 RepID=A0A165HYQ5_EXIGL|nr:WD40 repeat-like protein [Exidia glandulosa HHB12029]
MANRKPIARDLPGKKLNANIGTSTPPRADKRPELSRRKQTLITLLDALRELQDDDLQLGGGGGLGAGGRRGTVSDERDGPTVDDHIQAEGAAAFETFQIRVKDLDRELQTFSNAVTQLGSSVGLLSSSFALRQRLTRILHLVRDNAAELFPRKVRKETLAGVELVRNFSRAKLRYKPPPNVARPVVGDEIDPESFPEEIEGLAKDTINFLNCLNEFPEFTDESVNASIVAFEGDLKYWANCLREFEGQFRFPGVTRYVHDLSTEIGEHLENITTALVVFVEVGVPTIRFVQKHGSTNLLNLSTIATFFSAVTATTIQYSFDRKATTLDAVVNAFWYSSLVFSIASAVNSLVGLTWKQAMYRSPGHRVPWWVLMWIKRTPLIFLVISVAAFSVGLVLFTYSSGQPGPVCTIVTVFTACSSFGLVAVSSWFIFERWAYARHKGQIWLDDILSEVNKKFKRFSGVEWMSTVPPKHIKRAATMAGTHSSKLYRSATRRMSTVLPVHRSASSSQTDVESLGGQSMTERNRSGTISPAPLVQSPTTASRSDTPISPDTPRVNTRDLPSPITPEPDTPDGSGPASSTPLRNHRLKSAVRSVMLMRTAAPGGPTPFPLSHKRQATLGPGPPTTSSQRSNSLEPFTAGRLARIGILKQALLSVAPAQSIMAHQALVRHLAFSPNGKFLATCSWDRTSTIIKVADLSSHRVLAHPHGFVGQVMWSPNGSLLLTKLTSGINVWTEDGVCKQRIERRTAVHSITWFANGTEFLSIEANEAVHLDVKGKVLDRYPFERLRLHDVAITPDGERLFAVATLEHSKDGYKPVKARAEKRIVVYNRLEKEIENQVPVLHDVRDITISKDSRFALVSYEHKAPPQLWRIGMVKGDARLALLHTYMPNQETDFAGPSYFGGKDDQLIFCASKAGDIHIWDRESGTLLRHVRPEEGDGESLTCIAWNHASDNYMFATGSHEGTVRLWQANATGTRNSLIEHDPVKSLVDTSMSSSLASPGHMMTEEPERIVESPGGMLRQVINDIGAELRDDGDYFGQDDHDLRSKPERKRTISFSDPLSRPPDDDN